ncbi:hypothetical protein [Nannocystis pusilla]|uniref:hypothetical protein n=1 Tax=Nannocystis pusilla TaxID=889268 RepID=UPI003B7B3809
MRGAGGVTVAGAITVGERAAGRPGPEDRGAVRRGGGLRRIRKELRASYAYLERGDFDVEAHLQRTREAALRTTSAGQLRRVLHRSAFAFTDPHLLVAPLDDDDPNVWPTSADLAVALRDDRFVVTDVRAGSAADEAGVRPGWTVRKVDGVDIDARVTALFEGLLRHPPRCSAPTRRSWWSTASAPATACSSSRSTARRGPSSWRTRASWRARWRRWSR